ncbi:hypothetical protein AB4Z17_27980, partial [Paenibacillus sp. TAF43_2]|uniref:hypothetical protein n=1 Tax=Paenibacillus sp. TAF43_2 TaxID=3233069 RepID=UPI003F98BB0E
MVDSFVGGTFPALTALNGESVNPLQIYIQIGSYLWFKCMMALLIYSLASVFLLKNSSKMHNGQSR